MLKQVGKYEFILLALISLLILFNVIGKPFCVACFFGPEDKKEPAFVGSLTIVGTVSKEPEIGTQHQNVTVEIETIKGESNAKVLLFLNRYIRVEYGDRIEIKGMFIQSAQIKPPGYQKYLERNGIRSVSYYPTITFLRENRGSSVQAFFYRVKEMLRKPLLTHLPEPHSALLLAMTLGDSWRIPPHFYELLIKSGIIHIVSISGLHITIITTALFVLLIILGFHRKLATFIMVPVVTFYILLVGLPASAVRSGIMGIALLLGYFLGRGQRVFYIILLTVCLMLVWDISWLYDISFQLSFAAVTALALLYPEVEKWFFKVPERWEWLKRVLVASLVVEAMLFPLLGYHFGRISLVSPLVNLLILPITPIVLILTLVVEASGSLWHSLWFLSEYTVRVISLFGNLPFSFVTFTGLPPWFLLLWYAFIFGVIYYINYKSPLSLRLKARRYKI